MSTKEIEREIEKIIRYHKTPEGYVVLRKLQPKVKAIRLFIEANFDPKADE